MKKPENQLTLKELKEELELLRRYKNNVTVCKHSKLYLKRLKDEVLCKKFDKRISIETYADLSEIEMRCANLISKMNI